MTHLTEIELIDAAEGALADQRRGHLADCAECRRALADIRAALACAAEGPVPDPSPLFWDHFSARVRTAIAEEPRQAARAAWWRWPAVGPLAGLAALVVALVNTVPSTAPEAGEPTPPAVAAVLDASDGTDPNRAWAELADLVGPLDWDHAGDAGLALTPGDAELAVLDLTDEERQELSRLIAGELARLKS